VKNANGLPTIHHVFVSTMLMIALTVHGKPRGRQWIFLAQQTLPFIHQQRKWLVRFRLHTCSFHSFFKIVMDFVFRFKSPLAKFGLEMTPEKTKVMEFGPSAETKRQIRNPK